MVIDDKVWDLAPYCRRSTGAMVGTRVGPLTSTRRMGWSEPEHEHLTRPWAGTECRR